MKIKKFTKVQKQIMVQYKDFFLKYFKYPSYVDMNTLGITRPKIRHHFGNMGKLEKVTKEEFAEDFAAFNMDVLFSPKVLASLQEDLLKYKTFIVTTAVTGCEVNKHFYKGLKSYCNKNKARLLILPAADPAHSVGKTHDLFLIDAELRKDTESTIIYSDVRLNANLAISTIKLSAKQINPLTGLKRIGQKNGSFIYASPKQFLETVATSNNKLPLIMLTTGACTNPDYTSDIYMAQRTAYLAHNDHVFGALVVEIQDNKIFHVRQIQADGNGNFIDLGIMYNGKEVKKVIPAAFVAGDIHSGQTDMRVLQNWKEASNLTGCKKWILHDIFDGASVNHHERYQTILLAKKAKKGQLCLEYDFKAVAKILREIIDSGVEEVIIVKSNHDDFLDRWLETGEYTKDPYNYFEALQLAEAKLCGKDVIQFGTEHIGKLEQKYLDKLKWLHRDEDYKIANIECGTHGDMGVNGSRANPQTLENSYGNCVAGHSHTPRILRGVWIVGTSSFLRLGYNHGPSSWLNSGCIIYGNGSRQMINSINGKWTTRIIKKDNA
jgi:hypothetical protein